MLKESFPDASLRPSGEAFVDTVPQAVSVWQQTPLCAGTGYPQDGFEKVTAVLFGADIDVLSSA
jgi:hypothetical protein